MSPSRGGFRLLPTLTFLSLIFLLAAPALALQANLAGIVDWHKPLIGVPLLEPTPPSIIDTALGRGVVSITRKNVLAVLDLAGGDVRWRQRLEDDDPVVSYHVHDDTVLLLSGPSASTARLFNLTTGHAIWERTLHDASTAQLTVPVHLGTDATFTSEPEGSIVILSDGRRVSKLSLKSGEVVWSLDAPGAGSTILFKQLLVSDDVVHVLAITSSFASQTLTTMSLDLSTSAPIAEFTQIPSIVEFPEDAHLASSDTSGSARVVWFEHGRIRTVYLGKSGQLGGVKDLLPGKGRVYQRILNASARDQGWILGQMKNGEVDAIDVREGGKIFTTFEASRNSDDKSPSVYSAAKTKEGVVFNRVYWSFTHNWAVFEALSLSPKGELLSSGYSFAFDTAAHGVILNVAGSSNIVPATLRSSSQIPSIVITTSSGAIQLVTPETIKWTREESLSEIAAVRFVDLGEPEVEEARHLMADETFAARLTRHISELKDLPGYLVRFAKRLTTASYTSAVATSPLSPSRLHRDQFGFQKLLVVATQSGKLVAMDSANGNIVWARNLGTTNENGTELAVSGMWNVRGQSDLGAPMLALIAVRTRDQQTTTVGFHINAYTGEVSGDRDTTTGLPSGKTISSGHPVTAFPIPFENCGTNIRVLAVVDASQQLNIFPACKKVAAGLADTSDKVFFTTLERDLVSGTRLVGHSPVSPPVNISLRTSERWANTFAPQETVLSIEPVVYDNIASFGRVLGDKSTLYKYLNPHLSVVTTMTANEGSSSGPGSSSVYVVDTTTGRIVYSATVGTTRAIVAKMVENWLVFSWVEAGGWRISSVELYEDRESSSSSDKLETPGSTGFSASHRIKSVSKTFILPTGIKSMGFTTSRFGITARELVLVTSEDRLITVSRRLLDPRRPIGKPTSAEKEEFLIPYDALIAYDPKRVVTHTYPILGLGEIDTSPALVESTSLVFAHGLDLFLTRGVTPSGTFDILSDDFNKAQLLLTLAALSVGIAIAKPAVGRKLLKMKWY